MHGLHILQPQVAGRRYAVKPTQGFVQPGTTRTIKVFLVPGEAYTDELRSCTDRFAIQSVVLDDASVREEDISAQNFVGTGAEEARLRVSVVRHCY